jgi:hypothetical protein
VAAVTSLDGRYRDGRTRQPPAFLRVAGRSLAVVTAAVLLAGCPGGGEDDDDGGDDDD